MLASVTTETLTQTSTQTATATATELVTATRTVTRTSTETATVTASRTEVATDTQTGTALDTGTTTTTVTDTAVVTATRSGRHVWRFLQHYTLTGTVTSTSTAYVLHATWPHTSARTATVTSSNFRPGIGAATVAATQTNPFDATDTRSLSAMVVGYGAPTGTTTVTVTRTAMGRHTDAGWGSGTLTATGIGSARVAQAWTYHRTYAATGTASTTDTITATDLITVITTGTVTAIITVPDTATISTSSTAAATETFTQVDTVTSTTTLTETQTLTATVTSTAVDAGIDLPNADAPPTLPDASAECLSRQVDENSGVFVSTLGADSATCGSRQTPCRSVQVAIANATTTGRAFVYLAPGRYVESVALAAGVSLEGGWLAEGDVWSPDCGPQANATAIIQAPSNENTTILADALNGSAALRRVTVLSKAQTDVLPGESLYGILARGATTRLSMEDIVVAVVSAGAGRDGAVGEGYVPYPPVPDFPARCTMNSAPAYMNPIPAVGCNANVDPASSLPWPVTWGTYGSAGLAGLAGSFDFTDTGYAPSNGSPGASGGNGGIGPAGGSSNTGTCWPVSCNYVGCIAWCTTTPGTTYNNNPGVPGCGGKGGGEGMPGHGGGSSFALYVWGAQVQVTRSVLNAGDGGSGGDGGLGGCGWSGARGVAGTSIPCQQATLVAVGPTGAERRCQVLSIEQLPGGAAGGLGGPGGRGGQGGPGGGGWSCAYYQGGSGVVEVSASALSHGLPGQGGAPSGSPGLAAEACGVSTGPVIDGGPDGVSPPPGA